ncbi:hypothetical protein LSCM1_03852 [Leishmania martiniquensis]|uniref:C2H2-type domain-containing protein n=1 Tax=Leishmania martiniquensis TaxID=1580590 RepID=A0A836H9A6_9TRYP|nr:hypothetical protein LSCM1_03852 [Leishmania martiniquensis]
MPFHFRLYNPPCDATFLSLLDGEALYNADGARTRDVKEATIRQLGWHRVELPSDWFLSRQALETMTQLLEAMQCTMQYLKYCGKHEERRAQRATAELRRCEEERAAACEELIELREALASYKRQLRDLGEERLRARSPRWAAPLAGNMWMRYLPEMDARGQQLPCCFCANVYPSRHALESHIRKRHKRPEGYAAVAATPAAVPVKAQKKQEQLEAATRAPVSAHQVPSGVYFEGYAPPMSAKADDRCGDQSLREQISELRQAVAMLTQKQAELHRSTSPSQVAAAPQPSAGREATAAHVLSAGDRVKAAETATGVNPPAAGASANAAAAVASSGPLPGLPQRDSMTSEEDFLLRMRRELLHTRTELQPLQSAVEKERENREQSVDDRGPFIVREGLAQSHQRQQQQQHPMVEVLESQAAPALDPQVIHPSLSCTEYGDVGIMEKRRRSEGDSLVTVSLMTPPTSVIAEPRQAHCNREEATAVLEQKGLEAVPPKLSESLCGTTSGPSSFIEAQRPASVMGNLSVSSTSALGLPFSGKRGDNAVAAYRHGALTPQPAPGDLLRGVGTRTGERSPTSLGAAASDGYDKQGSPRETKAPVRALPSASFQSHAPWMGAELVAARFDTADLMSANRYGCAPTAAATPWSSGHLCAAAEQRAHAQQIMLPGFTRAEAATPSLHLAPADKMTNAKSELMATALAESPQRRKSLEGNAAAAAASGEAFQPSGSMTQSAPTELGAVPMAPSQREAAPGEGLCGPQLPPHLQTSLMAHITPTLPRKALSSASAGTDQPLCSTSPVMGCSAQRLQGETYDGAAASAAMTKNSTFDDLRESPPSRSQVPIARLQHTLVNAGTISGGSGQKIIPVVHLVPEALSDSGKVSPQNSKKHKRDDSLGGAPASSPVSLPSPLGMHDSFQLRYRGDRESGESQADTKSFGACSAEQPRRETEAHHDARDETLCVPFVATAKERIPGIKETAGDGVMEDVRSDALATLTSYAAEGERAARAIPLGASAKGSKGEVSHFVSHYSAGPMASDEQTPSPADPQTVQSVSSDYYYSYTYSYSDEEESVAVEEGTTTKSRPGGGGQKTPRASAVPPRTDSTPPRHTAELLPCRDDGAPHGNAGAVIAEKRKISRYNLQKSTRQPADQQGKPPQQQQPDTPGYRDGKQVSNELANVRRRSSAQPSASAPPQMPKKPKGFFSKLFSKKGK